VDDYLYIYIQNNALSDLPSGLRFCGGHKSLKSLPQINGGFRYRFRYGLYAPLLNQE
jgi:hypothetical protein